MQMNGHDPSPDVQSKVQRDHASSGQMFVRVHAYIVKPAPEGNGLDIALTALPYAGTTAYLLWVLR